MIVPKEGPQHVQLVASPGDDGAWLVVSEPRPWWAFWRRSLVSVKLDKFGLIWLYQAVAKYMRRRVVQEGFDEMQFDLQASLAASPANIANRVAMNDEVLEQVAIRLRQKGWVKL